MTVPFTYLVFHVPTNKAYYGVRYADGCNPSDLWVSYFTSSKRVKRLIQEYGKDSFRFEIRKIFSDKQSALLWEQKVLSRLNLKNGIWINNMIPNRKLILNHETMKFYWSTDSYRQSQIESQKKTWANEDLRQKHSELMKSKFTEERRKKQSENAKKQWSKQDKQKIISKISETRKQNYKNYKKRKYSVYKIVFMDDTFITIDNLQTYADSINVKYHTLYAGYNKKRSIPSCKIKLIQKL